VAGAAGLGLFHISHRVAGFLFQVEQGVVANPAVVVIFFQVNIVAEYDRIGIFEGVLDVFRLYRFSATG
jgi:hypothetical protein